MKLKVLLCLIVLTALSLSACGSKKEPAPEPETSTIADEPVALAPEPEEEEVVEEGFKCLDEMYSYTLEDGVIQIDDIILDMAKGGSFAEVLAPFVDHSDRYVIDYGTTESPKKYEYDPAAEIESGKNLFVIISRRNGGKLLEFYGICLARKDTTAPLSDCYYMKTELLASGTEPIWFAGGFPLNGEGISLDNLETSFFNGFTKGAEDGLSYEEVSASGNNYRYQGSLYSSKTLFLGPNIEKHTWYKYRLSFDKDTRQCNEIWMEMKITD